MPDAPRDEDLVRRFLSGDRAAFAALVERHERRVYNLALRMTGREEDARDATQDAPSRSEEAVVVPRRGRFTTWLHRVTVNACYDLLRKRQRAPAARTRRGRPARDRADARGRPRGHLGPVDRRPAGAPRGPRGLPRRDDPARRPGPSPGGGGGDPRHPRRHGEVAPASRADRARPGTRRPARRGPWNARPPPNRQTERCRRDPSRRPLVRLRRRHAGCPQRAVVDAHLEGCATCREEVELARGRWQPSGRSRRSRSPSASPVRCWPRPVAGSSAGARRPGSACSGPRGSPQPLP